MRKLWLLPVWVLCLFFTPVSPLFSQLNADFAAGTTAGCSPIVVSFSDQSTGSATSWFWNFGNGNTSTLQNPSAVYVTPGQYTVTLTVTNGANSDVQTRTNFITVYQDPTSNFAATAPTSGCAPHAVSFQDQSAPGSGTINQWLWDFGDGQTSTQQNPSHTYATGGTFTVTLFVTDDNGCNHTFARNNYITVTNQPVANFAPIAPQGACTAPYTVNFTDMSTGGATGYSYQWDFGDGGTATTANPNHTYTSQGIYTVSLIIIDQNGCRDTLVRPNWIAINPMVANFTSNTTACVGESIPFLDLTPGNPISWLWNFGDGNTSTSQNPIHAYNTPGVYSVSMTASAGAGCSDTEVKTAWITINPSPLAGFEQDTALACSVPFTVSFSDTTVLAGWPITSWYWDFGDGNTSNQQNPTHTYTVPGVDTVTLAVMDAAGCVDTLVVPDAVRAGPPMADFNAVPQLGCIPQIINFFDLSISYHTIVSWQWDFGDGGTSTLQNPSHTYTTLGRYDVTLIMFDSLGCSDTLTRIEFIEVGTPPTIGLSATPLIACASDAAQFTSTSSPADEWRWEFGDGSVGFGQSASHLYRDTGWFDVRLSVGYYGCWVDTLIPNYIYRDAPVADFGWNPLVICDTPFTATFVDRSIDPDSWFWDFGDGNTSTLQNPVHTYASAGNYTVRLYVDNNRTGCVDSSSQQLQITRPVASFTTFSPRSGCFPLPINFFNTSTSTVPIIESFWHFGDGDTSNLNSPAHTYLNPGTYSVTLIITDANGCVSTLTRPNYIVAYSPNAAFTANPSTGCDPLTVNFVDQSTPHPASNVNIVGWQWDFGDGGTSNLQNPSHVYQNSGSYSVRLIVTDGSGCVDTLTQFNFVQASSPTANFTVDDPLACEGYLVGFTDASSGSLLTYQWDFGDGGTSAAQNPTHAYALEDTFDVRLIVTDGNGCRDTLTLPDTVLVVNPVANFSANPTTASCPPLLVNFTDLSLPTNGITGWSWNFGDGTSSVLQNPTHLYTAAGDFDVTLIAELIPGCTDTLQLPDLINISGPSGTFTFAPDSGCTPLTTTFIATALNTLLYTWDFGDGNVVTSPVDSAIHTYTQTGTFFPILILDDGLGCTVPIISPDPVEVDTIPLVDFTSNSTTLCLSDSVYFTDLTVAPGVLTNWLWDFGDGNTSTLQNPVHVYTAPGVYDVKLVVLNSLGCTDSLTKPAQIQFLTPPTASFTQSDTIVCPNSSIQFSDQSTGLQPIGQWIWSFGNGNGSILQNPVGTFDNSGTYPIRLIIEDNAGCRDTAIADVQVNPGPTAAFVPDNSTSCAALPVVYTATGGMGIIQWEWDFDNGSTGQGNPVSTVYPVSGTYSPSLIVTDTLGCRDTLMAANTIFVDSIVADFSADVQVGCPPLLVAFTDNSFSDTTLTYYWEFGDGNTSTLPNPSHVYNTPGTYIVQLIITNAIGCSDTIIGQVIEVYPDFTAVPVDIYSVTVLNNFADSLSWVAYPDAGFSHYVIYREMPSGSGNFTPIDSIYNRLDTTYRENGLNTRSTVYCYKLVGVDVCGNRSSLAQAQKHCTMDVEAQAAIEAVDVTWTPYIGFDSVRQYEIYRVTNYNPAQAVLLANVNGTTHSYRDSNLVCGLKYCYRIKAIEAGGYSQVSWSDTSCAMPVFPNFFSMETVHATVEQDRDILVEWLPPPFAGAVELYLEKSQDNANWNVIQTLPPTTLSYVDQAVDVHGQSYYYRVSALDSCGSKSQLGNHARSILLTASLQGNTPYLSWNPYSEWAVGVDHYVIEVYNEATMSWDQVAIVPGNQTQYLDRSTDLGQAVYCYRVQAEELGGNESFSLSNEDCVPVGPVLFAPSAFTPNGDGLNDIFHLTGSYIRTFRLILFNRWGVKIFESNDLSAGWDGTYKGKQVQEGVYVWRAWAVGEDGTEFEKVGSVTLIR